MVTRLPSGDWSPPSGIRVLTLGLGPGFGICDIHDCLYVLETPEAARSFMRPTRLSLSGEASLVVGSAGSGKGTEIWSNSGNNEDPVRCYIKGRGLWLGIQGVGTVFDCRDEANANFYGQKIRHQHILQGMVPRWPPGAAKLMQVLATLKGPPPVGDGAIRRVSGQTQGGQCSVDGKQHQGSVGGSRRVSILVPGGQDSVDRQQQRQGSVGDGVPTGPAVVESSAASQVRTSQAAASQGPSTGNATSACPANGCPTVVGDAVFCPTVAVGPPNTAREVNGTGTAGQTNAPASS